MNNYPFTAIVGQEVMKKALLLNAINPAIGGVLIRGQKGTGKSTAVRALTELLPALETGKPMRVVELPINATEDRVVGTLDIERAITRGEKHFEPGILAEAHGNILYVDEVNLLDDHIVDVLLDAAAMGVNTVEREGVSYSHPSRFIMVGTMNPEEGDLRPQLLDRFGMVVDVIGEQDPEKRCQVLKNRISYENDPEKFREEWESEQQQEREKIEKARQLLSQVMCTDEIFMLACKIGIAMDTDGHRADICMIKAAVTIAAYDGRTQVSREDLLEAARYVLPHRMRKNPFQDGELDFSRLEEMVWGEDGA